MSNNKQWRIRVDRKSLTLNELRFLMDYIEQATQKHEPPREKNGNNKMVSMKVSMPKGSNVKQVDLRLNFSWHVAFIDKVVRI